MTAASPELSLGRHVFGAAALAFGLVTLVWPDYYDWLGLRAIWNVQDNRIFDYVACAAQIVGGAALQSRRTAKSGAVVLGTIYLVFAGLCVPQIIASPRIYERWGNFFEQFSLAIGAASAYPRPSSGEASETLTQIGRVLLGICVASFGLEQAIYLDATAALVPKWLPPSQQFLAVTTTIFFALAAVSLVTNRLTRLATRLLTIMVIGFGVIVWIPLLFSDPHNHTNWSETVETFAIAGATWILADRLSTFRLDERRPW